MTPAEEQRITLAAQKAAAALPPMSEETRRKIARIAAEGIREQDEQAAGAA